MRDELGRKEVLMQQLVQKSKILQRQVTFDEVQDDPAMAAPNDYSYYWRSFSEAAEIAWSEAKQQLQNAGLCGGEHPARVIVKRPIIGATTKTKVEWMDWMLKVGGGILPTYRMMTTYHPAEMKAVLKEFGSWQAVKDMNAKMKPKSKPESKPVPKPAPRPKVLKSRPKQRSKPKIKSKLVPSPKPKAVHQVGVASESTAKARKGSGESMSSPVTEIKAPGKLRQTMALTPSYDKRLATALGAGSIKLLDMKLTVEQKGKEAMLKVQKVKQKENP